MKRLFAILILSFSLLGYAQEFNVGYTAVGWQPGGILELGGGGYRGDTLLFGGEGMGGRGWGYGFAYLGYALIHDAQRGFIVYPRLGFGGAKVGLSTGLAFDVGVGGDWVITPPRGLVVGFRVGYIRFTNVVGSGAAYVRVTFGGGGFFPSR